MGFGSSSFFGVILGFVFGGFGIVVVNFNIGSGFCCDFLIGSSDFYKRILSSLIFIGYSFYNGFSFFFFFGFVGMFFFS